MKSSLHTKPTALRAKALSLGTLVFLFSLTCGAPAQASLATQQSSFDWQARWGTISFSDSIIDPGILSTDLPPKSDIKSAVGTCGTQTAPSYLSLIKTYEIDVNEDGIQDIITDGSRYFSTYSNGCAVNICTSTDGCYLSIYRQQEPTNVITEVPTITVTKVITVPAPTSTPPDSPSSPSDEDSTSSPGVTTETITTTEKATCPASAEANTECLTYCPATVEQCPANFTYNMTVIFNNRVKEWGFISASDFDRNIAGSTYTLISASEPVLYALVNNSKCYSDELAANNNQCIKYYQYSDSVNGGGFKDLYVYESYTDGEYDTRFTYTSYDRTQTHKTRGMTFGGGFGHKFLPGMTVSQQFADFTRTPKEGTGSTGFFSVALTNNSSQTYFVPTNTDEEFNSFLNNLPAGVATSNPTLKFTDWVGDTTCSTQHVLWGQSLTIAAQRFCQSSTSAYMPCSTCVNAKVPGWEQGCTWTQTCTGTECVIATANYAGSAYVGKTTTMTKCLSGTDPYWIMVYYGHGGYSNFAQMCDTWFYSLCSHGCDCLAPEQMIALPEGKAKRIDEVHAGDQIMGFRSWNSALEPMKVDQVAVTDKQHTIKINDSIKVTANQLILNNKGAWIRADKLHPGDLLYTGKDKKPIKVEMISTQPEEGAVYSLRLKGGMGFVANGLRVQSLTK